MLSREYFAKISGIPIDELVVGFTASTFDLLTAGHSLMLEEAKNQCNFLVIGLETDPTHDRPEKNKPVQSIFERYVQIASIRFVDYVVPFDDENDLLTLIKCLNPDVRIVGEEYRDKDFTGKNLPIKLWYNSRRHDFSSTELRKRVVKAEHV